MDFRVCKILVAATGSVASLKVPDMIKSILQLQPSEAHCTFEVELMVTEAAKHFIKQEDLPPDINVYDDTSAYDLWQQRGDPVLHSELPRQTDMLLIAPLDANTLAKITHGLCDNLLTTVIRSWNFGRPCIFCPSMTPGMWVHPMTEQQINILKKWGFIEIPPIHNVLMCGAIEVGAMADIETITETIAKIKSNKCVED